MKLIFCGDTTSPPSPLPTLCVVFSVQTQSPVLQGKMLVPMATVRTAPAPAQQFPIVAPPLPVQNGAQTGSKVCEHFTADKIWMLYTFSWWNQVKTKT